MKFNETTFDGMTVIRAENLPVCHAFTTRLGGYSSGEFSSLNLAVNRGDDKSCVSKNYEKLCRYLGTEPSRMVFSSQVHGDKIRVVTERDCRGDIFSPSDYQADGLITDRRGIPLVIFIADCISILLYSPDAPAIGAVHAGWRGSVKNIAGKAVKRMAELYGCRPENIQAAIGPAIGKCCYETGPEIPEEILKLGLQNPEAYIDNSLAKPHVDLKAVNRALLIKEGIEPQAISVSDECTMCKNDKFWSHRATGGKRGAQAAVIML